jgi:uncharacterized protein (DUF433 family)
MASDRPSVIRRPDKGLTISGTRVTLYALMDYFNAGWAQAEIREWLNLTEEQLGAALEYIDAHRAEVESEYQDVVRKAAERRRYWDERLRSHRAQHPPSAPAPEKAALYAKLAEQRGQLLRELLEGDGTERDEATLS